MNQYATFVEEGQADKEEAIRHWNNRPCGSEAGGEAQPGTEEFYARIDHNRYDEYAPWMPEIMGFDEFAGQHVLEVGFGMGTDLFQFARHGATVSGVDLTPKHLEIARARFDMAGIPADLRLADAESLPFDDATFDAVYTFGVIHHTPNTQRAIDEIYRVLKPGGAALITVYHRWSAYYVVNTILSGYILRGRFIRSSYRSTLARIEGATSAKPLVKVYSKRQLRRMMRSFKFVAFRMAQFDSSHLGAFVRVVRLPTVVERKVEPFIGWYLVARGTK